jgi:hypothetical protein
MKSGLLIKPSSQNRLEALLMAVSPFLSIISPQTFSRFLDGCNDKKWASPAISMNCEPIWLGFWQFRVKMWHYPNGFRIAANMLKEVRS